MITPILWRVWDSPMVMVAKAEFGPSSPWLSFPMTPRQAPNFGCQSAASVRPVSLSQPHFVHGLSFSFPQNRRILQGPAPIPFTPWTLPSLTALNHNDLSFLGTAYTDYYTMFGYHTHFLPWIRRFLRKEAVFILFSPTLLNPSTIQRNKNEKLSEWSLHCHKNK